MLGAQRLEQLEPGHARHRDVEDDHVGPALLGDDRDRLRRAGGYGHLHYWTLQWQPTPIDRAVRIDIERAQVAT